MATPSNCQRLVCPSCMSDLGLFAVAGLGDSMGREDDRLPSKNGAMVNRQSLYRGVLPLARFKEALDQINTKPECQHWT